MNAFSGDGQCTYNAIPLCPMSLAEVVGQYTFHTVSVHLQPPITLYGVEGRYATALFSAASKQGNLETVEKELVTVSVSACLNHHACAENLQPGGH